MPLDVYDPCPCGSGKKLKFCCQAILPEMEKVAKFQENNQPRMALQVLEGLTKSHPQNPWVVAHLALNHISEGRFQEAKEVLQPLLAVDPDHSFAVALYAMSSLGVDRFEQAKSAVQRAFQVSSDQHPELVGSMALSASNILFVFRRFMASRQHLALALRLVPENERQGVFMRLLELDSNGEIPYPLRSTHPLEEYSGTAEIAKDAAKARQLSDIGGWEAAARIFSRLAEQEPDNAILWQNAGLCRAWNADETEAAEALHRAARLHADHEAAVECETIAQLLDLNAAGDTIPLVTCRFGVPSVAKLLTRLVQQDRLVPLDISPPDEDADSSQRRPTAAFQIADRSVPSIETGKRPDLDLIPHLLGEVLIFDSDPEHDLPAQAILAGYEGEVFETARQIFEDAAGEYVEPLAEDAPGRDSISEPAGEPIPRDLFPLRWHWPALPPTRMPVALRRELEQEKWRQVVEQVWPEIPLRGLGGKTPREAADDPELKIPLTAAIYVLDAFCDQRRYALDVRQLCRRFHLEEPRPIEVSGEMPLNSLSAMQLHRLPVSELNDAQLHHIMNRALLIHHGSFLYQVLMEVLKRPAIREHVDLNRVYLTLADLCQERSRRDEALEWVAKGREHAGTLEGAFENTLQWEMRELSLRLEDPTDPQLHALLRRFYEYYVPKLPELRPYLTSIVEAFGIELPWSPDELVGAPPAGGGPAGEGGIWTPTAAEGGAEKKLWLPGQE